MLLISRSSSVSSIAPSVSALITRPLRLVVQCERDSPVSDGRVWAAATPTRAIEIRKPATACLIALLLASNQVADHDAGRGRQYYAAQQHHDCERCRHGSWCGRERDVRHVAPQPHEKDQGSGQPEADLHLLANFDRRGGALLGIPPPQQLRLPPEVRRI